VRDVVANKAPNRGSVDERRCCRSVNVQSPPPVSLG
jgi:hypothetical protein